MAQPPQMNMAAMGGPVGGPPHMVQMNMGTPSGSNAHNEMITKLNTAIYDYLLRSEHYDVAKLFLSKGSVETKDLDNSPSNRPGQQPNGMDDSMDIDAKDPALSQRPEGLPLANNIAPGPFLQDWWCQFWETFNAHRNRKNAAPGLGQYINAQRPQMQQRMGMMNNLNQNNPNMRFNNPMMQANGMAMNNDVRRAAMQNSQNNTRNMTPQQLAQMQNMKAAQQNGQMMQAGNQMERSGSQMDNRSGSPGSGDAPSPKRQRLEGGMQQMNQGRPGQPGQMQPGSQSAQVYSQAITKQMEAAMNNVNKSDSNLSKGLPPNMGSAGAQGSPMSQAGMDGSADFYAANGAARMPMQNNAAAAAAAAGQAGNNGGNHALQDYQMQLMLLEQQNKKRLLMARQEQDNLTHPAGVPQNGNFPPGMSPQGSARSGSPNPNDPQRGSPTPGGSLMDPNNMPPQMRAQMQMMGANGQMMRPPSSHPAANLTPAHMEIMRQGGMQMPNGQFAPGQQPPQGMMPGGQPGQPGQGPQGTPRQANNQMPPPPAPAANASGGPSSPSQQPAPPTPSTTNKAKPGNKKEANKKGSAAKKGGAANATAASEAEPPTPTPATPVTPMNAKSFNNTAPNSQQMPNGAPAPTQQPPPNPPPTNAPPQPDPNSLDPFGSIDNPSSFNDMDLGFDPTASGDLDNFDFDSFLNNDGDMGLNFDANFAFDGAVSGSVIEGGN